MSISIAKKHFSKPGRKGTSKYERHLLDIEYPVEFTARLFDFHNPVREVRFVITNIEYTIKRRLDDQVLGRRAVHFIIPPEPEIECTIHKVNDHMYFGPGGLKILINNYEGMKLKDVIRQCQSQIEYRENPF